MQVLFKLSERYKDVWELQINDQKWRDVHRTIFGRNPKFPSIANEEKLQTAFDQLEYQQAKKYLIWRLSSQSYHSEPLKKLLRDRLVQNHTIEQLINEFQSNGILDDKNWIQNYMHFQKKKHSLRSILFKLQSKGFSSETIKELAKEWHNPADERESIQLIIKKKYKNKNLSDYKTRQKVANSLIRRGFSFEQVNDSLKNLQINID